MGTCYILEHSIDLELPFGTFERNIRDFAQKHEVGECVPYSTNSDGKFRMELKVKEVEQYLLRLTGWRQDRTLHLCRLYVAEPLGFNETVTDFLDLLEVWAKEHSGSFYFKYIDVDEPLLDAYHIIRGLERFEIFTEYELQKLVEQYG